MLIDAIKEDVTPTGSRIFASTLVERQTTAVCPG
jgi:hypothetical protein